MDQLRLSPSRISDFNNCPQLYKYRTIDLLPEPPSVDAERGTLIHTVLEDLFELPAQERDLKRATELLPSRWQSQIEARPAIAELVASRHRLRKQRVVVRWVADGYAQK